MNAKFSLIALAALSTCSVSATAQIPPPEEWEIGPWARGKNYSISMPAHPSRGPSGSITMQLPVVGSGEVDALTTSIGSLEGARQITLRYRIDAPPSTRFLPSEAQDEQATVSLYFQRRGDTWTARGRYAAYRWYSPMRGVIPMSRGEHTVVLRFDETWTNVYAKPNTSDPRGYAEALREASRIGIAFGSRSFRSHGIYATGPARFTLLALDIE